MRDVTASAPAVFEPEEVEVLAAALRRAVRMLHYDEITAPDAIAALARLVHNLGRSRLRLNKPVRTAGDAERIAEEAAEITTYLSETKHDVAADAQTLSRIKDRAMELFPASLRALPQTSLAKS